MLNDHTCASCMHRQNSSNDPALLEAAHALGDSSNPVWCKTCQQLFLEAPVELDSHHPEIILVLEP